jgi:hypothetical protein
MPRFTISTLFTSTTMIAAGTAIIVIMNRPGFNKPLLPALGLWFSAGALIGAGAFLPFNRPVVGVLVGLAVQAILVVVLILTWDGG